MSKVVGDFFITVDYFMNIYNENRYFWRVKFETLVK